MGVVLSEAGAKKLKSIVAKVDGLKPSRAGQPLDGAPGEDSCWGFITGCDLSGRRYSFVRIVPDASADSPDIILNGGILKYRIVGDVPHQFDAAYEVNGGIGIATGKVVRMTFAGFRPEGDGGQTPVFCFQYEQFNANELTLPIHDHRDAVTGGGFAFSVMHPGTSLPQQPFHP